MFAAATVTDSSIQSQMISQVRQYASMNYNNTPFPAVYNPSTGATGLDSNSGTNRYVHESCLILMEAAFSLNDNFSPASGGIFSLLALE